MYTNTILTLVSYVFKIHYTARTFSRVLWYQNPQQRRGCMGSPNFFRCNTNADRAPSHRIYRELDYTKNYMMYSIQPPSWPYRLSDQQGGSLTATIEVSLPAARMWRLHQHTTKCEPSPALIGFDASMADSMGTSGSDMVDSDLVLHKFSVIDNWMHSVLSFFLS